MIVVWGITISKGAAGPSPRVVMVGTARFATNALINKFPHVYLPFQFLGEDEIAKTYEIIGKHADSFPSCAP